MDERQIAEEAVQWFETLKAPASGARQHAGFAQWLKRSPRNVQHFLFATTLDHSLQSIDPQRRLDVDAMLAEAGQTAIPMRKTPLPATAPRLRKTGIRRAVWPIAAGIAATCALAALLWQQTTNTSGRGSYVTAVGEQRTFQLADGSILQMNTGSRVQVRFSAQARDIELLEGEALFKVAQEAARPFRVQAGDSVIQALGTQFNVYRRNKEVTVAVLEGRVAVHADSSPAETGSAVAEKRSAVLAAGETARVEDGAVSRAQNTDISNAVAWRQRRLVFKVSPLGEVVAEFNRYNRAPRLRLDGIDGNARHYTGTFDADDPESLALLLSQDATLEVRRDGGEIVIRQR